MRYFQISRTFLRIGCLRWLSESTYLLYFLCFLCFLHYWRNTDSLLLTYYMRSLTGRPSLHLLSLSLPLGVSLSPLYLSLFFFYFFTSTSISSVLHLQTTSWLRDRNSFVQAEVKLLRALKMLSVTSARFLKLFSLYINVRFLTE